MQSRWNDDDAIQYEGDLAQRVYTSRLLGRDASLVLHGGGNTSVKIRETNVVGEEEDILYVKGSGWDLATIEPQGFSPVRLERLLSLARLQSLSDTLMTRELKSNLTDASAPSPSVEAILHAILPHRFVDHTHADAFIAVSNTPSGLERIREIYGDSVVVVPYVMPGFKLARVCADMFPAHAGPLTIGMALMNHGLFSFGDTARESYERMIDLVTRAEEYLQQHDAWDVRSGSAEGSSPAESRIDLSDLRRSISDTAGTPMIVATHYDAESRAFADRVDLMRISQQGPATPDHVIRTKRLPMVRRDVQGYRAAYEDYFTAQSSNVDQALTMLDPAPRVVLVPGLGMCTIGRTAQDASIVEDMYRHTMKIILQATALEEYRALPAQDVFDAEYWELEQAKLRKPGGTPMFLGEIGLVTGAASGIGKATVDAFVQHGAAVVAVDINPAIVDMFPRPNVLGLQCDVSDEEGLSGVLDNAVRAFGGVDMLVLNAGLFPSSRRIDALPLSEWDRAMRINLDANLTLMREAHPLLSRAPRGGRVAVIGSKNVPAPGPGAAAYSASKAALTQLARVAALEWGSDGIRVNIVHPNAVFDTGLWTDDVLQARAHNYGMTVEEYKTNNVLRVEVTSLDVAELAVQMCGPLFAKTTGAQVPIDGGNERVI